MSFFNELGILFTGMTLPVVLALVLGYIFIVVELYRPGLKIFGVVGAALVVLAAGLRVTKGDGNPFAQIFAIIFIETLAVFVAFMILILTVKKGWMYHTPHEDSGALSLSEAGEHVRLYGKLGVALTDLAPDGKVNIGGVVVEATTDGFYIKCGEGIRVVNVEGNSIGVERAE